MAGASHEIEALLRTSDNASEANFPERRQRELGRITLPRTPLNKGKKKAGPPFLGGGMRWPARPRNGIVIQASKFGEHPFHAVTRYSAVCAAHPQGERTSQNAVKAKFAELPFHALG
jgi:hypothetical protein